MTDPAMNERAETEQVDLHAEHLNCPHCGTDLFRVDHAPEYDDMLLYCTACARRAEVAFDDPDYVAIVADAGAGQDAAAVSAAVEARLRPCMCGGRFRADAPRRCHHCDEVVLVGEPRVDLWPGYCDFDMERGMPSPEDVKRINAFDASNIRRMDLWQR